MKIARRGNRFKKMAFANNLTAAEMSIMSANIEKARARLEKMRPVYQLAYEKWLQIFDESKIENGILAGPVYPKKLKRLRNRKN
jgi:hypothetical protein